MSEFKYLKSMKNSRVFLRSDSLAARSDMIPCDAEGKVAEGHIGDAESQEAMIARRKSKYLGNLSTGVLFPYSDILATRADLVSIDTEEQWESVKNSHNGTVTVASDEAKNDGGDSNPSPAPGLQRTTAKVVPSESKTAAPIVTVPGMPDISGLGAREAKTVLADWAKKEYNADLDRRIPLPDFVEQCRLLIESKELKAG